MPRARKFYETIFDIKLETMEGRGSPDETVFFPRLADTIMAQSGILSGCLVKSERLKPSAQGPLIYFNAYPSIDAVLSRVESAGGKIVKPKTRIPAGLIAVLTDSEGNTIAVHAAD